MTPEMTHRALRDIESAIEVAESRDIMDTGAARAALYYLRSKVDRLEGEIARYREEPSEEVVERAADAISAEIPSGINEDNVLKPRIMKWAKAAIEAYRSAVND